MSQPVLKVGDARDLSVLGLGEESVDCIITSPPYWDLKKYGDDDEREIGHGHTKAEYRDALGSVFEQCFRLTKPSGVMWLVADTIRGASRRPGPGELIPLPFELAEEARRRGWRLQDVIIWKKNKTLPYSGQGKLRNLIEYVLFLTKTREFKHRPYRCAERHRPGAEWLAGWPERYHPLGRRPSNLWEIDIETQGIWDHSERLHYCPFPQELVARCLDLSTDKGDVVFDPFAGVGTVLAQAVAMGREAYGMELNAHSAEVFKARVLPEFQADWEAGSEHRRLARQDQLAEAQLILQLRLLKAGKELMRLVERLRQNRSVRHPVDAIESVVVVEPQSLAQYVDAEAGTVGRPPARLVLLAPLDRADQARVREELEPALDTPPFTTFGLDIEIDFAGLDALAEAGLQDVREFGQSRKGAYTAALQQRLFPNPPRLLTTVRLPAAISGDRRTPLDIARADAERTVLERELASGRSRAEIGSRLGLPEAKLRDLLVAHGLLDEPSSFAISLPDQMAISAD